MMRRISGAHQVKLNEISDQNQGNPDCRQMGEALLCQESFLMRCYTSVVDKVGKVQMRVATPQ